jgi:hypothetical protein
MRKLAIILSAVLLSCTGALAQTQNPRIFVTDSKSWEIGAGAGGVDGTFGAGGGGGARPQTAEIIKTFNQRCSNLVINNQREKADYVVLLDHEGGKSLILRDNKIAVFNRDGDAIFSRSTRSLGNAIQEACGVIVRDWANRTTRTSSVNTPAAPVAELAPGRIQVASTPAGADIEVDGTFVGNTPSAVAMPLGEHVVVVRKPGYKSWERNVKVTGGDANLVAELERIE